MNNLRWWVGPLLLWSTGAIWFCGWWDHSGHQSGISDGKSWQLLLIHRLQAGRNCLRSLSNHWDTFCFELNIQNCFDKERTTPSSQDWTKANMCHSSALKYVDWVNCIRSVFECDVTVPIRMSKNQWPNFDSSFAKADTVITTPLPEGTSVQPDGELVKRQPCLLNKGERIQTKRWTTDRLKFSRGGLHRVRWGVSTKSGNSNFVSYRFLMVFI